MVDYFREKMLEYKYTPIYSDMLWKFQYKLNLSDLWYSVRQGQVNMYLTRENLIEMSNVD